jgi:hypothetical protein
VKTSTPIGTSQPTKTLIDQLQTLKATASQRAVERENARVKAEQEHRQWIKEQGTQYAIDALPSITTHILRIAERENATEYEVQVQTSARDYELDTYDSAYAEKLAELLRNEGLGVEWVRTTHEPGQGSYYSFSETRYDTTLKVTW